MKTNDNTYFIYVRKSTESDGRQVLSIPAQIEEAQRLQEREHLRAVGVFSDSKSAKIPFNRLEYTRMIKQIKLGKANGIIVWKIDRLSRNHLEGGELIHLLQTGVIKSIWTPNREYVSSDSALLISLEASMASQYSVDLSENVKRGLEKKIAMGQPPLIARIGYLNTKHGEHGTNSIIVDRKRWPLMRKAFELMLTRRYTIQQICNILNDQYNFRTRSSMKRTGGRLAVSVLHRAFTDPFYTGHFYYKSKLHKGSYKPMITLEEYDTIQEILGRKVKSKPNKHDFAFTGLMTCGCCGCAITATRKTKQLKSTGEIKSYAWYHCTKRKGATACEDKHYTPEAIMEQLIIKELETLSLKPTWKRWAAETIKLSHQDEAENREALLKNVASQEQKIQAEIDSLLELRICNELSEEKYREKRAERELRLYRVQEQFQRMATNLHDWMEALDDLLNFAENVVERFKNGDNSTKKSICQYIGWNWCLEGKNLTFTRREWFEDLVKLKNHYVGENERLEPVKTFVKYRQTASFQVVRSIGCGLRDHIRTQAEKEREKAAQELKVRALLLIDPPDALAA